MKISTTLLAGVTVVAAAQTGIEVVNSAVAQISNATAALREGVAGFQGAAQALTLLDVSNRVLAVIQNATTNVTHAPFISGNDALQLTAPILNLTALVNGTVQTVIDHKPIFDNNSLTSVVLMSLQQQQCASMQFSNATSSRLPLGGIQLVAQKLSAPILQALANGIVAYSTNMTNNTVECMPVNSTGYAADAVNGAASRGASSVVVALAAAVAIVMAV